MKKNMYLFDNRKIVTIITVVYNDIRIEETIKSVIPFLTNAVEYIIIDGGSKDGTELLLKKYESYLDGWESFVSLQALATRQSTFF